MKIQHLRLHAKKLGDLEEFYCKRLGLECQDNERKLRFNIGESTLEFIQSKESWTYHYAVNIPWGGIEAAKRYLEEREVSIIPFQGRQIVEFPSWEARAIYFYDPAGNIVEWIARKSIDAVFEPPFDRTHTLHISEIGCPVDDVRLSMNQIKDLTGCTPYDASGDSFAAIGDAFGLFILVNPNLKKWMPSNDEILRSPWILKTQVPKYPKFIVLEYREGSVERSEPVL